MKKELMDPMPPEGTNYFFRLSDKSYSAVDKDRRALATMFSPSKRMVPTMLAGRWYWIEDRADVMGFPKWMWLRDLFEWR